MKTESQIDHTANEKLDAVLTVLNNASVELSKLTNIAELWNASDILDTTEILFALVNINVKDVQLKMVLTFLVEEKYIISDAYKNKEGYRITFPGKVFIENKGYCGREKKRNNENNRIINIENRQKENNDKMYRATVILTIGTSIAAIYYLNELCRNYHWFLFCNCK